MSNLEGIGMEIVMEKQNAKFPSGEDGGTGSGSMNIPGDMNSGNMGGSMNPGMSGNMGNGGMSPGMSGSMENGTMSPGMPGSMGSGNMSPGMPGAMEPWNGTMDDREAEWARWQQENGMVPDAPENLHGGFPRRDAVSRVRFLHSAAGFGPLNVAVGEVRQEGLNFGQMSDFLSVPAGFAITDLCSSRMPGLSLYRRSLLYPAGSVLTAAIVNTHEGIGIRMIPEI